MNLTDVKKLTNQQLLKRLGFSIKGVKNTPAGLHKALKKLKSTDRSHALIVEEMAHRWNEQPLDVQKCFNVPKEIYQYFRFQLCNKEQEHFYSIFLDGKYHYLGEELISKGTRNHMVIQPCDVYRTAILEAAAFVIVAHNHTAGGEVTPSQDDIDFTARLSKAGTHIGIGLTDHIIIGNDGFFSMKQHSLM